jgi:hypothetical protein
LNTLLHRDEREVWLPHWGLRYRQSFRDGVCVTELLIAIRCKLLEQGNRPHGWFSRFRNARGCWHLRRATRITSFIVGDPGLIKAVLHDPHGRWWCAASDCDAGQDRRPWAPDRARLLPWQRSTASWQAAYNTACLYAALADTALRDTRLTTPPWVDAGRQATVLRSLEHRVILSLEHAVQTSRSELEHPSDWIESDPDFRAMRDHPRIFTEFRDFLLNQQRQDYPVSFLKGYCPVRHADPDPGWVLVISEILTTRQTPVLPQGPNLAHTR